MAAFGAKRPLATMPTSPCAAAITALFNELVGAQQERFRYREAERLGGFKIDD